MDERIEERACLCALNRTFGFEPKVGLALLERFGSGREVFRHAGKDVGKVLAEMSREKYLGQVTASAFESAAMELEDLSGKGCRFVGIGEEGYPALLRECDDPPIGLYFKGGSSPEETFNQRVQVAVVGTRALTSYGRDWCQRIVSAMSKARSKPLVVSGLALGVDVTAHRTALENGLPTVAVMATGIDDIYPERNRSVGEQIASTPGCALVSDYPPGTSAVPFNFLRRNRIIAGCCSATILVESKVRGGGMMTARLAHSYDRDVMALPGRIDDPVSQGCNLLIKETMAEPVGDLGEMAERLGLGSASISRQADFLESVKEYYGKDLEAEELETVCSIAMFIKKNRGASLDEICQARKLTFSTVTRYTSMLECDGFISIDLLQHCSASPKKF